MKRRLKKNQVVVTALAVMVAVAGYLNYSGMEFGKETATLGKVQEGAADEGAVSTSLIDIPSLDEDVSVEETGEISAASDGVEAETGDGAGTGDTPGEAVLTSVTAGSSFAAEAKLTRENRFGPKIKRPFWKSSTTTAFPRTRNSTRWTA